MEMELQLEVRPTEIDIMGHVNHCKYLEYLEWGREKWYSRVGTSFDRFQSMRLGMATVNVQINYRKELLLEEKMTVYTKPLHRGNKSYTFAQRIVNEQGDLVSDAQVTSVVIDLDRRCSVALPEELAKWFPKKS